MRNTLISSFSARNLVLTLAVALCTAAPVALAQSQSWSYAVAGDAPGNSYSSNPLTPASDGNLYWAEDDTNGGSIYRITPGGVAEGIFPFSTNLALGAPSSPSGPMIQGPDGYLYGIALVGGANNSGAFFKIALDGSGFQDLYDFNPALDGGGPTAGITLGSDGNFYGISNLNWKPVSSSTHHTLNARAPDLRATAAHDTGPHAAGQHSNGSLSCGSSPSAVFFQLTPAGTMTFLYCTTMSNLPSTQTPLVQASDGNFYGISSNSYGSVLFQFANGSFNVIGAGLPTTDTAFSALAGGPDGKFYAAVNNSACGSILQFDPTNSYAESDFADLNCTDAERPLAWDLFLASDGAFYTSGTRNSGSGAGAVVRMDMTGALTYPYDFVAGAGQNPYTAPVQNSAGTFFGTTASTGGVGNDIGGNDAVVYSLTSSYPALAAPVTLSSAFDGTTVTLDWTVNNASPLTPPNCVALVNNSTGVTGWSGMVYGTFGSGVYSGSATVTQTRGTTVIYQIVCPAQGAASASVSLPAAINSRTLLNIGPSSSMVTGTAATLTATVSRFNNCGVTNKTDCAVHSDNAVYPTGTVTFTWNNQTIGQATLSNGVATLLVNTTNRAAQSYSVTAAYSGNAYFATSSVTESGTLTAIPTTTTLTVVDAGRTPNNAHTITAGNNATLTAQVTASSGTTIPTGTVSFNSGSVNLGSASLINGSATFNVSSTGIPAGSYNVTATYSGNRTHATGTSAGVNVIVAKATTVTTVFADHSTVERHQADQLTATVTSSGDAPTGSVHFLWNNYFICAAPLSNGSATCIGAAPGNTAYGPYSITAAYMGDHNNNASTSQPITVTVAAP